MASKAPSLSQALFAALSDLSDDNFQLFKLYLEDREVLGEYEVMKRHRLRTDPNNKETDQQTKERAEILKTMKDHYGIFTISVMRRVLETLPCRAQLEELSECLYDPEALIAACRKEVQAKLKLKFAFLTESLSKSKDKVRFNEGYTEVFITEADPEQVTEEYDVRQMETPSAEERTIKCQDIFKGSTETEDPIRVVLTKGVSGVGKTVLTQKFSLDWAEGRANQDVQLLFHFTFRDLNKFSGKEYSLVDLLHHQDLFSFQCLQLLFVFDGLDECGLLLNFRRTQVLSEPTERAPVEVLLVNLIRGDLLPSARLWITTRHAAANHIPDKYVSMVTEVQGFTDEQKEQYFRKRFRDEQQASDVISHIRSIRSLYIMSRIPVFSWIISKVLQKLLEQTDEIQKPELPKTLTQMYVHFLVVQAKVKNIKFHGCKGTDSPWTTQTIEMVRSLGKLAFEQLQNGKQIFNESDLSQCGLDAAEIARDSGVITEVFREEPGQGQNKVYCFIHLSVQEFIAALHVHQTFFSSGEDLLSSSHSLEKIGSVKTKRSNESVKEPTRKKTKSQPTPEQPSMRANAPQKQSLISKLGSWFLPTVISPDNSESDVPEFSLEPQESPPQSTEEPDLKNESSPEEIFYCSAVDQALQSPNGHLDLFLRFLLGLSLSTNHRLLPGQLTHNGSDQTTKETVKYIKEKLNEKGLSAEKSLNLLHCLNELNDSSLLKHIQRILRDGRLSWLSTRAQWSAVSFLLLSSDSDLEHFDLRKYCPSEKALLGLLPVIKASTKSTLSLCGLSSVSCGPLASVLSSSSLTQLDLSNNDLQDSGVKLLCEGLKSAPCRLHTLSLSGCLVSGRGGASLAAALGSASSQLRELDLRYNHPGQSSELLTALQAPHGPLQTLRLDPAGQCWLVPGLRKYFCEFSLDRNTAHKHLFLNDNPSFVTWRLMNQQYPDHEDRFTEHVQVLSSSGLKGRCYWEVGWDVIWTGGSRKGVGIAVSYRGIGRKGGQESSFGENDQSWSLETGDGCYVARHNNKTDKIGVPSNGGGVFLQCPKTAHGRKKISDEEIESSITQLYGRMMVTEPSYETESSVTQFCGRRMVTEPLSETEFSEEQFFGRRMVSEPLPETEFREEQFFGRRMVTEPLPETEFREEQFFGRRMESEPFPETEFSEEQFFGRRMVSEPLPETEFREEQFFGRRMESELLPETEFSEEQFFGRRMVTEPYYETKSSKWFLKRRAGPPKLGSVRGTSGRVGVFLDWEAGVLSFYQVRPDGGLYHIYTFTTTFTEPLFPGFRLTKRSSVNLFSPNYNRFSFEAP